MSDRARHREPLKVVDEEPDTPVGEHTHEQPRSLLVLVLTVVTVLLSITVGWLLYTTYTLQQGQAETTAYIEGRGAARDAENQRLNDRVDQAVCDVLDHLPAGALLDPTRTQYGCGPGVPVAELDPAALENLAELLEQSDALTVPVPTGDSDQPGPSSQPGDLPPGAPPGAEPSPMGQAPATTTAAPTTAPAPTTGAAAATTGPPLVDLSTVTDQVCAALGVCL